MKTTVTEKAKAKINLTLDVLAVREDGYHDIKSVMQTVELCDQVTLTKTEEDGIKVTANVDTVPLDESNTVVAAVRAFEEKTGAAVGGLSIHLEKNIPVAAGIGGGSSDAAAVLRGLDKLYGTNLPVTELAKIGINVGSDVPFCVYGGTCVVEGRGEEVGRLTGLSSGWIVLCKPDFSLSSHEMYQRFGSEEMEPQTDVVTVMLALEWEDVEAVAKRVQNVFETVLTDEERAAVSGIKETMLNCGAAGAAMSGSGPMVYGIFIDEAQAKKAVEALQATYSQVFLTEPA